MNRKVSDLIQLWTSWICWLSVSPAASHLGLYLFPIGEPGLCALCTVPVFPPSDDPIQTPPPRDNGSAPSASLYMVLIAGCCCCGHCVKLVRPGDRLTIFLSWLQLPGDCPGDGEQQRALHHLSKWCPVSAGVWGCADHAGGIGGGGGWQVFRVTGHSTLRHTLVPVLA